MSEEEEDLWGDDTVEVSVNVLTEEQIQEKERKERERKEEEERNIADAAAFLSESVFVEPKKKTGVMVGGEITKKAPSEIQKVQSLHLKGPSQYSQYATELCEGHVSNKNVFLLEVFNAYQDKLDAKKSKEIHSKWFPCENIVKETYKVKKGGKEVDATKDRPCDRLALFDAGIDISEDPDYECWACPQCAAIVLPSESTSSASAAGGGGSSPRSTASTQSPEEKKASVIFKKYPHLAPEKTLESDEDHKAYALFLLDYFSTKAKINISEKVGFLMAVFYACYTSCTSEDASKIREKLSGRVSAVDLVETIQDKKRRDQEANDESYGKAEGAEEFEEYDGLYEN